MPDVPTPVTVPCRSGRLPGPLAAVAAGALDPAYRAAAAARPQRLPAAPRPEVSGRDGRVAGASRAGSRQDLPRSARLAALLAATGMLLALGGLTQRAGAPARARLDAALTAERDRRAGDVTAKRTEAQGLRATVAAGRAALARDTAAQRAVTAALAVLEPAAGTVAATGAGLRVEIADTSPADATAGPRGSGTRGDDGLADRDLAALVNALWAGHARAIAVDGVRLSAASPIRTAGDAILVDFGGSPRRTGSTPSATRPPCSPRSSAPAPDAGSPTTTCRAPG